jgi:hypothetical protein
MATVKKNVLGDLSGRIGNITTKLYKNKRVFSALPSSFTIPTDENSVLRRLKFSSSIKMTKEILNDQLLSSLWTSHNKSEMNNYNYLMKTNYKYLNGFEITELNQLTPITGFRFNYSDLTFTETSVNLQIDPVNITLNDDVNVYLFLLFQFLEPSVDIDSPFDYKLLVSDPKPFVLSQAITFSINFSDYIIGSNALYNKKKILLAIVTANSLGEPANFSASKLYVS